MKEFGPRQEMLSVFHDAVEALTQARLALVPDQPTERIRILRESLELLTTHQAEMKARPEGEIPSPLGQTRATLARIAAEIRLREAEADQPK